MDEWTNNHCYLHLAGCYCRGRLGLPRVTSDSDAVAAGLTAGLRLGKFKRNAGLPRVRRVLGTLRGFAPDTLLDVGSGRGAFLWPLLDEFPVLWVTAIDLNAQRVEDLQALTRGGVQRLSASRMDATSLTLADQSVDGVTLLEVLEHMPEPERAVRHAVRVARRFVIASVPLHEDDNPEHLHLLSADVLSGMFQRCGAPNVRFSYVPGHLLAVVPL
jgi:SAM-dependent methyltransferase